MKRKIYIFFTVISSLVLGSVTLFAAENDIIQEIENGSVLRSRADVMGRIDSRLQTNNLVEERKETTQNRAYELYDNWPFDIQADSDGYAMFCNLDDDPELEIVFAGFTDVYAYNIDGSNVTGWPNELLGSIIKAISFGDVDGDGEEDIVLQTENSPTETGHIYAFTKGGEILDGFPITHGEGAGSPALSDIDGDGDYEIFVTKKVYPNGFVYVFQGDGTIVDGWPQQMDYIPGTAVSVGDITGDGIPEVVAESYYKLWAWDKDGVVLDGFPFDQPTGCTNSYSDPILVDLDGDNIREIVYGTHGFGGGPDNCYVIKNDGTVMDGWPKLTVWGIYSTPAIADIDNDGFLDIVVGDQVGGANVNGLYAWDRNGNNIAGFPVLNIPAINIQPLVADIDNDGFLEIIVDDNGTDGNGKGLFWAYNHDGSVCDGFPLEVDGSSFYQQPFMGDLQNDGILDLFASAYDMNTYYRANYLWNTNTQIQEDKMPLTRFKYNLRHNGVYGDYDTVDIDDNEQLAVNNYQLKQNYPNPFNPVTKINYELGITNYEKAEIVIHNAMGQSVWSTLVGARSSCPALGTTNHGSIQFDGSKFNSGIYYYSLVIDGKQMDTKSMVLIK